jgi:8-oxo-dGTP pyrophosphatase MutT (NUDIX family)
VSDNLRTIHKVAAIVIEDNKLFMVRKRQKDSWTSLGGRPEEGETEEGALSREVKEEVNCAAEIWKKIGDFEAPAAHDEDATVKLSCYLVKLHGTVEVVDHELAEAGFIGKDYREKGMKLASITEEQLIPYLKKEGLLDW